MAGNAHRNVSVDITGDPTDLERAYDRASKKAKDLDDQLDDNSKRDQNRIAQWVDHFDKGAKSAVSALSGISTQSGLVVAAILAGFVLLGPAAAVTASAITLAFGAALTGIGILAAAESLTVRGEFSEMWQNIKNDIISISGPIEQSLLKIPGIWQEVVSQFRPHLEDAFAQIAPAFDLFVKGWSLGFQSLIPAIEPLTQGIQQLFIALGVEGPDMFGAFGDAITTLANTTAQHADMFAGMLTGIFEVTNAFAKFMDYVANDWQSSMAHLEDTWNWLTHGKHDYVNLSDVTDKFKRIAETGIITAQRLIQIQGGMDGVSVSADGLKTALDELSGVHITADMALLKYQIQLDKTTGDLNRNAQGMSFNTDEGRLNREQILKLAEASHRLLVARAAEGATTNELSGTYEVHRDNLVRAIQTMGKGKKEAEDLADRYLKIPKHINTNITADTSAAQSAIDNYITLNSGRQIPIHIYNKNAQLADGGYIGYPNGGLVRGPGGSKTDSIPARVSRGEYVVNAAATRRHLPLLESINTGKGVGGMGTTIIYQVNTTVAPTANLAAVGAQIVESIQAYETRSGRTWRAS